MDLVGPLDQTNPRQRAQIIETGVLRTVVDDEDFEVRVTLVEQRIQAGLDVFGFVLRGNEDRDLRGRPLPEGGAAGQEGGAIDRVMREGDSGDCAAEDQPVEP